MYSEDGKNHRTFTVKATYLDAMSSLTITGTDGNDYTGTPVDTDYDDIADTITVTLPASAVVDGYGEIITDPKAAGLMKGDADTGNFRPTDTMTRAEAASIMMNAQRAGLID